MKKGFLPVALLIGLLAAIGRAFAGKRPPSAKLLDTVKNLDTASSADLDAAAIEADKAGMPEAAQALAEKAAIVQEIEREELANTFTSPFPGVTGAAWSKFVRYFKQGNADTVTAGYSLGYFLMGMRALQDEGVVKNTYKGDYNGREVWLGDWAGAYSLEYWKANPALQYDTFVKHMKRARNAIKTRHSAFIGKTVEGKTVTLSGLMGVSKQAGLAGLAAWLDGNRVAKTTEVFHKTNGIF